MPVPVPRQSKPPSHPVVKQVICGDTLPGSFQVLPRTLPVPSTGPPAALSTRDQCIDSLQSWKKTKPRRIWEDDTRNFDEPVERGFHQGLTVAGNASVIKGAHAEASIPPIRNLFPSVRLPTEMSTNLPSGLDADADDDMISDYSARDDTYLENQSQWSAGSSIAIDANDVTKCATEVQSTESAALFSHLVLFDHHSPEGVASTPVLTDQSPSAPSGPQRDSSPLQPVTPFGLYVDRAIASESQASFGPTLTSGVPSQVYTYQDRACGTQCYATQPANPPAVLPAQGHALPSTSQAVSPTASAAYRKLAEPLSDWVANYVWKVCTTGLSLPSAFALSSEQQVTPYSTMPPGYLAASVHSLLLSTLLQPSAIFLAIWYIVRLPVYFLAAPLGPELVKEARFRAALLGESRLGSEREILEASAPFRLIVLGCMLANKWLDDHTFSNKTWHNISNVPIQALNKLESLTLDVFAYDLTVSVRDWSQWLTHINSYHSSLASPIHTQPISRPSTNPHSIVRKAIDEITFIPARDHLYPALQPVFVGLEERRQEKLEKERAMIVEVAEIDLDEDGPLREEYLPKRRVSGAGYNQQAFDTTNSGAGVVSDWGQNSARDNRPLPPPARWSPAGDEPIYPEKNRATGRYAAVQPPPVYPTISYQAPDRPPVDVHPHYIWNSTIYPAKPQTYYGLDLPIMGGVSHQMTYGAYPYIPQIPVSHSRSQSLSYEQENLHSRNHTRSYSQAQPEYPSDLHMAANEYIQGPAMWRGMDHYQYGSTLAPIHNVFTYQSTWLRT